MARAVSLDALGKEKPVTLSGFEHLFSGHSACNVFTLLALLGLFKDYFLKCGPVVMLEVTWCYDVWFILR